MTLDALPVLLNAVVTLTVAAGQRLVAEWTRPDGPRDSGSIAAILLFERREDLAPLKASFHTRLPKAIAYEGNDLLIQVEFLTRRG